MPSTIINHSFLTEADVKILDFDNLTSLQGFAYSDNVIEGLPDFGLKREYCFSTDFNSYGDWKPIAGLSTQVFDPLKIYQIKIKYSIERFNPLAYYNASCVLLSNTFTITTITVPNTFRDVYFKYDSLFNDIAVNDLELNEMRFNLLQKVRERGIVPEFISRGEDFDNFWDSICYFLALQYKFARQIIKVYDFADFLALYLKQRGMIFNGYEDILRLRAEANLFFSEFYGRGNFQQIRDIRNLIMQKICDEWIFLYLKRKHHTHCLGHGNMIYKGLSDIEELNEIDMGACGFVDPGFVNFVPDHDNSGNHIMTYRINPSGLEPVSLIPYDAINSLIVIHPKLDYEISFFLKIGKTQDFTSEDSITVGCGSYKCDGTEMILTRIEDNSDTKYFIENGTIAGLEPGRYYHFRFLVLSHFTSFTGNYYNENFINNVISNYKGNLKFKDDDTRKIFPILSVSGGSQKYIYGLRVAFLKNGFSLGFMNPPNMILNYYINNNIAVTEKSYYDIVDKSYIPANSVIVTRDINQLKDPCNRILLATEDVEFITTERNEGILLKKQCSIVPEVPVVPPRPTEPIYDKEPREDLPREEIR